MLKMEEFTEEIQKLQEELRVKDQEIQYLKKELISQLNLRETELKEGLDLARKYTQLEKRYHALRNSSLGKLTIHYWNFRSKLKRLGKR